MNDYFSMSHTELAEVYQKNIDLYNDYKGKNLKLDMSRGKPGSEQLDISADMLDIVNSKSELKTLKGIDCRNYGLLDGIPSIKKLFSELIGVDESLIFIGGNSSLNMMYDTISFFMTHGIAGCKPWGKQEKVKFLCPVPGYDRHFAITEYFGIEMINIPMLETGPDMDMVEQYANNDESVKGIWCVPKYSNPQGITYSDDVVIRFSKLTPKAKDFRIFWDNAYCIHDITDTPDVLLNIMDECKKNNSEDLPIIFASTSKITFPGSGVAVLACSENNMKYIKEKYKYQTIGYDKLNMLRHMLFFKNSDGVLEHMQKHREILQPKFNMVLSKLDENFSKNKIVSWKKPNGGYFVSVDVMENCAKRVVELCKEAGVVMTNAGATYPKGIDPKDRNIRIAPTYPSLTELDVAMDLFCLCVKIATLEKLLNN